MSEREPSELTPEERAFVARIARSYRADPLGPGEAAAFQARLGARLERAREARARLRSAFAWGAPALAAAALAALVVLPRFSVTPVVPSGAQASLLIEYAGLEDEEPRLAYLPDEYALLSTLLDEPWNESAGES